MFQVLQLETLKTVKNKTYREMFKPYAESI